MLIVGKRVIPWILHHMAHTGSRELFRLSVLAIALGIGLRVGRAVRRVVRARRLLRRHDPERVEAQPAGGAETLPLRDAFAVLFFVSVGMLFDPAILLREPGRSLATLAIILIGKSLARLRDRARLRPPDAHRAHHLGEPGADRRVLLHPRQSRRRAWSCCRSRAAT